MDQSQNIDLSALGLPIGYRFIPTDEELVVHYLKNKVLCGALPADVGVDIEANSFYSQSPTHLVTISDGEKEWYFFIHLEENSPRIGLPERKVVNDLGELGFWKKIQDKTILNREGELSAIKYRFVYFSQKENNAKRTHWRMDEYQLPCHVYAENNVQGMIVLAKLIKGMGYNISDEFA